MNLFYITYAIVPLFLKINTFENNLLNIILRHGKQRKLFWKTAGRTILQKEANAKSATTKQNKIRQNQFQIAEIANRIKKMHPVSYAGPMVHQNSKILHILILKYIDKGCCL